MSSTDMECGAKRVERADIASSILLKRLLDIVLAACVLVVCLPLILFTALAVGLALGPPLLFRQERAGRAMTVFQTAKFRTMTDARDQSGNLLPDNQRQTPLTKLLRRYRLDELPQLFAVLRGDMSFIGPRPLPLATLLAAGEPGEIRCSVRPGMTGWAQVNGNTLLSNEQKLALDVWYVDHHSVVLDIQIVALTLRTLVTGEKLNLPNIEDALAHLRRRAASVNSQS